MSSYMSVDTVVHQNKSAYMSVDTVVHQNKSAYMSVDNTSEPVSVHECRQYTITGQRT
jgi:hypothetical protein